MTEQELQDKAKDLAKNVPLRTDTPYPEMIRYFFASMYLRGYDDGKNDTTKWHYPSRGELPDKDWSKHPLNVSKECFVVTKRGVGTIARWDDDYRTWFEKPRLAVIDVIAWQYFVPPKKEYTY